MSAGRPLRIFVFGKTRSANRLIEDAVEDLRAAGHEVLLVPYRAGKLRKIVEPWLLSPRLGAPLAGWIARRARDFRPDLMLAFGPFHWLPGEVFAALSAMPGRPPLVAWIGDLFGPEAAAAAAPFDAIAYTDSAMLPLHGRLGFRPRPLFLPLAANRTLAAEGGARAERLAFVASATPARRALLAALKEPVALFGADWRDGEGLARHVVEPRRIGPGELARVYAGHLGALNIRHDVNVLDGLNQRHFAPYLCGAPVVSDAQPDLATCFEPGREVLVWRDAAELDEIHRRLRADPALAARIAEAGRRRVLAEHTYAHRVAALVRAMGS